MREKQERSRLESSIQHVQAARDTDVASLNARVRELEGLVSAGEAEREHIRQQAEAADADAADAEARAILAGQDALVPLNAQVSELEALLSAARAEGEQLRETIAQGDAQVAAIAHERDEALSQIAEVHMQDSQLTSLEREKSARLEARVAQLSSTVDKLTKENKTLGESMREMEETAKRAQVARSLCSLLLTRSLCR